MALSATVGDSAANSYVTQAAATTYFGDHPLTATWTALTSDEKDQYLILATTHIDMQPIDGVKYDETTTSGAPDQALRFPRAADYDGGVFIPAPVAKATYEQAIMLAGTGASSTRTDLQRQGVVEVALPDITEKYDTSVASTNPLGAIALGILEAAGLLSWGASR